MRVCACVCFLSVFTLCELSASFQRIASVSVNKIVADKAVFEISEAFDREMSWPVQL